MFIVRQPTQPPNSVGVKCSWRRGRRALRRNMSLRSWRNILEPTSYKYSGRYCGRDTRAAQVAYLFAWWEFLRCFQSLGWLEMVGEAGLRAVATIAGQS